MDVDLHAAGMTDDLDKTVNYAEVCELIRRTMQEESYDLIEAAAENVADAILLAYPQIKMVHVIVSKPGAPIPMDFDTVCVDIQVTKVSSYIITEPYGDVEQDDFLNGCLEIETIYSPQDLLAVINDIEQGAGRKRLIHWGPRTLDIDILLYDQEMIMEDTLKVEMAKRAFVLEPLAEIAPYAYHPGYHKTIIELLEILQNKKD